jgi:hypothetical protein
MRKEFNSLTTEQKDNFEKRLQEMGFPRSRVVPKLKTGDTPGPSYLSSHPDVPSEIAPHMITVDSLAALRNLGGIADSHYLRGAIEEHHEVPSPWPKKKNHLKSHELTPEENRSIRQAFFVQMYGNSERVKSYETIIENHHFPIEIAAFAAEEVVVDADHPLILEGPTHIYNFGVVRIKKGGQIICGADVEMTVQKMIREDRVTKGRGQPMAEQESTVPPITQKGTDGKSYSDIPPDQGDFDPPKAAQGTSGSDKGKNCGINAGTGATGATGLPGKPGGNGGNGGDAQMINLTIDEMIGHYVLHTIGGNGGNGGRGGKGGKGQTGGDGGVKSSYCVQGPQGQGGKGGKGGKGGQGGNGGNAGRIYVNYRSGNPTFELLIQAGVAGLPGAGGSGGDGGDGNPKGGKGEGGDLGDEGKNGLNGDIFINGKKQST